jgi:hypothetical protein
MAWHFAPCEIVGDVILGCADQSADTQEAKLAAFALAANGPGVTVEDFPDLRVGVQLGQSGNRHIPVPFSYRAVQFCWTLFVQLFWTDY